MRTTVQPRLGRAAVGLLTLTLIAGCNSDPEGGPGTNPGPVGPGTNPGPATQLVFREQPANAFTNRPFPQFVEVAALDMKGDPATGFTGIVTVTLSPDGSLTGTTSQPAVGGVATFPDLRISQAGAGYTLTASTSGLPSVTTAAFDVVTPGPGRIAFQSDRDGIAQIYTMNGDGSNVVRLTTGTASAGEPAWSPDGLTIAFVTGVTDFGIYTMNFDGSAVTAVVTGGNLFYPRSPTWSPDGSRLAGFIPGAIRSFPPTIVVVNSDGSGRVNLVPPGGYPAWSPAGRIAFRCAGVNPGICVMNPDGTGLTHLTSDGESSLPAWAPDGTKIAFVRYSATASEVLVMNADGSGVMQLTHDQAPVGVLGGRPAWSPDGTKIAFASIRDGNWEIYVMNADGSAATRLTNNPGSDTWPSWSP